jgi:FMN phosphatase YigB (HAD superfamily)
MLQKILNVSECDPFQKIKECEVVSFDVFDTAIVRPFLHHNEMYYIIEKLIPNKKFCNVRIKTERNLRKKLIHSQKVKEEITIADIYEHIHIDKEKAIATELNFDIEICKKRQYVYKLYKFALNLGKKIIFISDITYSSEVVKEILHKNGYTHYDALYVSSQNNLSKHQGGLYKKVLFELNIDPHRVLHIGDSIKADIHQARKHGIKPLYIPRPLHGLENVINKKQFNVEGSHINSALFASCANIICQPSIQQKRQYFTTFPFIYKLAMRILKENRENIVFITNEGHGNGIFYLFSEIYSCFSENKINFVELDISQAYASCIRTFDDIKTLKQSLSKENFAQILATQFKIHIEDSSTIEDLEQIWHEIEIAALQARREILEKFSLEDSVYFYDFTMQNVTKNILETSMNSVLVNYVQVEKILQEVINKETRYRWFLKPNPVEIVEEMKSMTNEEMQRFVFPQMQYFFATVGKYLDIIDAKTFSKIF